MISILDQLAGQIEGEIYFDELWRRIYATDASVYREVPTAVILPKNKEDVKKIIAFAKENKLSITPRTAGTSQSGQAIGKGFIVDVSKHMNKILELNVEERWVRVQPGVVRDQLNQYLKPHGLFFSPVTSTANRAMIGGMVGNNSCGANSIVYGSTRDHVIAIDTLLSDGSECTFKSLTSEEFKNKTKLDSLEGKIYKQIFSILSNPDHQKEIKKEYPKANIERRNTGYAIDLLLHRKPFKDNGPDFNFATLLCGSEGTLAFSTAIKLHLDPLPLPKEVVIAIHCKDVINTLRCAQLAMTFRPDACELMDKTILDCTKANPEQEKNRFFLEGDPGAILLVEFRRKTLAEAENMADDLIQKIKTTDLAYAFRKILAPKSKQVWALRKAGLGVLGNLPGDPKSVSCIEDTAVALDDLPEYIEEFAAMIKEFGQNVVYYAHAGAGELHLRPILNLKTEAGQQAFYDISKATAQLVKKYNGSLSGEHGDGRVRAEFIPLMIGEKNYDLLRQIKKTWDPDHIFNPGKIVDAPPMKGDFRYEAGQITPEFNTIMDFSEVGGFIRMAEKCNGVGACRKLSESGGTMCPSYRATHNEKDTTRARANALREFINGENKNNPFDQPEVFDILKFCLSCKACGKECPSSVDMSALKAEFLHQYYQSNRRPIGDIAFANIEKLGKWALQIPWLSNVVIKTKLGEGSIKKALGVAAKRSLPSFSKISLRKWYHKHYPKLKVASSSKRSLYLFCDEFTNYQESEIGIKAVQLLSKLGYEVKLIDHTGSGRAQISKGFLKVAKKMANQNIEIFAELVDSNTPLVGLEPSAILSFRDEYIRLAENKEKAIHLKQHVFLLEEFLFQEYQNGNISSKDFSSKQAQILLHGHCHQKALGSLEASAFVLGIPKNYEVEVIPSGCCGMAGSFGYEKGNYDLSMDIGEMVLFPALRKAKKDAILAAPGTSCRHQIWDGTKRQALHPVEILWEAFSG